MWIFASLCWVGHPSSPTSYDRGVAICHTLTVVYLEFQSPQSHPSYICHSWFAFTQGIVIFILSWSTYFFLFYMFVILPSGRCPFPASWPLWLLPSALKVQPANGSQMPGCCVAVLLRFSHITSSMQFFMGLLVLNSKCPDFLVISQSWIYGITYFIMCFELVIAAVLCSAHCSTRSDLPWPQRCMCHWCTLVTTVKFALVSFYYTVFIIKSNRVCLPVTISDPVVYYCYYNLHCSKIGCFSFAPQWITGLMGNFDMSFPSKMNKLSTIFCARFWHSTIYF